MTTTIHGKHLQVTPSLQAYAERKIGLAQSRFEEPVAIHVTLAVEGQQREHAVEVTIPYHGMVFRAEVKDSDMYAAIDGAAEKIERILRKYKERARRRLRIEGRTHIQNMQGGSFRMADAEEDEAFRVAKAKRLVVKPVDIQEAILRMNMSDHAFHLFHNLESDRIEVVYRRKDGTYGHLFAE